MTLWRRETLPPYSGCVCDSTSWFSCSTRRRRRAVTFPAFPNTSPTRRILWINRQFVHRWHDTKSSVISTLLLVYRKYWIAFQRPQLPPVGKVKLSGLLQIWDIQVRVSFFLKKRSLDLCQQIFIYLLFVADSCFVPACCNRCPPNHMGNLHQSLWCTPESKKCSWWAHFYLLHQLPLFIQFRVPHPNNAISTPLF